MAIDLVALKNELNTDPTLIGLIDRVAEGDINGARNLLNEVRATVSINRSLLTSGELLGAMVASEWLTRSDRQADGWKLIIDAASGGGINPFDPEIEAMMQAVWPSTTTLANLVAARSRQGSRAEQLFGENVSVTSQDVVQALNLP